MSDCDTSMCDGRGFDFYSGDSLLEKIEYGLVSNTLLLNVKVSV